MNLDGWRVIKMGEIAKITKLSGFEFTEHFDYVEEGEIIALRALNVKKGTLDLSEVKRISKSVSNSLVRSKLFCNEIVLTYTGAKFGEVAIIKQDDRFHLAPNVAKVSPIEDVCYSYFLYLFMRSDNFRMQLNNYAVGSSQPTIPMGIIRQLSVNLPPLPEQKAIAKTLSCLDNKIELNNRMNKTLEEMAHAIFKSWFVDFEPFQDGEFVDSELGRIPKGWRVVKFREVSKFVKGKKPENFSQTKLEKKMQYLTIDVLNGGCPQYAIVDKMIITDNLDILMVMDGASSGTVYYGYNGIVGSTLAKLDISCCKIKEVVYEYLKINEIETKKHNTGSAIPHTDKNYVLNCKMVIPENEVLKQVSEMLKNIRYAIIRNKRQSKKLTQLRDSLIPKLMSGEIRVPMEVN